MLVVLEYGGDVMSRMLMSTLSLVGMFAVGLPPSLAQESPPPLTADDLGVCPEDTITWTPESPHRLRFGGSVTTPNSTTVTLTPFADVQKVLTSFSPALSVDANGVALGGSATKITAQV